VSEGPETGSRPTRTAGGAAASGRTWRSLRNRNFLIYLIGQAFSQTGNWFQQTAEIWLILQLTGSGAAVGFASALRFGPLLFFGIPAGLLVDRFNRRRLMMTTQALYTITTGAMAAAAFAASPSLPFIYTMILAQGCVGAVDNPLRRSVVRDLVTDDELANAVSLNSTMHTIARSIGPAVAGFLIVAVGVPICFALNSASYAIVLVTLFTLRASAFRPVAPLPPKKGQLREGFRYAWENHRIRRALVMVTVFGLSGLNWNVILPVYSTRIFGGDASQYGLLVGILGVGALAGGLVVARLTRITGRHFRDVGVLMAAAFAVVALAPSLPVAIVGLALLGAAATSFQIFAQTRLQLEADDVFSGRVLALYSVALVGTKPIGGVLVGLVMDYAGGPRVAFAICGAIAAVMFGAFAWSRAQRMARAPAEPEPAGPALDSATAFADGQDLPLLDQK
jgi:MFS family permease